MKAIAAMSINRVIGDEGRIPWHIPEDFKWFKQCTLDQVVVMGRKTFDSIGKPLPRRETLLVSRSATSAEYPGITILDNLEKLSTFETDKEIWICGGAEIYTQTLPLCRELLLTVVKQKVQGDAFFPQFEPLFGRPETLRDEPDFVIYRFLSKAVTPAS